MGRKKGEGAFVDGLGGFERVDLCWAEILGGPCQVYVIWLGKSVVPGLALTQEENFTAARWWVCSTINNNRLISLTAPP